MAIMAVITAATTTIIAESNDPWATGPALSPGERADLGAAVAAAMAEAVAVKDTPRPPRVGDAAAGDAAAGLPGFRRRARLQKRQT